LTIRGFAAVFFVDSVILHAGHVGAFAGAFFASAGPARLSARANAITLVITRTIASPFSRHGSRALVPADGWGDPRTNRLASASTLRGRSESSSVTKEAPWLR